MSRELGRPRRPGGDEGFVLIAVIGAGMILTLLTAVLLQDAVAQTQSANDDKREDIVLAAAEAALDRYASKLVVDPQYYIHRVDESERARTCTAAGHADVGVEVDPGGDWIDGCTEWAYLTDPSDTDWFVHPLIGSEGVELLLEVSPPAADQGIEVSVVGRIPGLAHERAISADINATSLAEFVRVTENELRYGYGAVLLGKVYSGSDLSFEANTHVHDDVHAEGTVVVNGTYGCPTFHDGALAFDTAQTNCGAGDIREVFPEPLAFSNFWDDLDRIVNVGCGGSGLCLDDGYEAYLIHPFVSGTSTRLAVWGSNTTPPAQSGCSWSSETNWWLLPHDASVTWVSLGTFDAPAAGVVWADGHVIFGNRGPNPGGVSGSTSTIAGGLTILAGTRTDPRNFILNTDTAYDDPSSFDVIGMIGSDEFIINPYAVGSDLTFELRGAVLGQADRWRISQWCGNAGSYVRFDGSGNPVTSGGSYATLNVEGAIATPSTGNPSGSFSPRNYGFDARLQYLRPPFYPLVGDDWSYENWSEDTIPSWVSATP